MELNKKTTNLLLLGLGAIVTTLAIYLFTSMDSSIMLNALGVPTAHSHEMLQATGTGIDILGLALGAGLALGIAGAGAGIGMGTASAAALGAITEKPETFGKSILYVVFIEAIAIYGFVIAFLLIGYIPQIISG